MKYNIGDIFIDHNFDEEVRCYLYKIDQEKGVTYHWLTYINKSNYRDTYWTEQELTEMLEHNVEYIPVE
jgi:hypothetical protein